MKGKEITVDVKQKTQEEIAKKVIEEIHERIIEAKADVKEAEDKLAEILEKDINDIKKEDANHWSW